MRIDVWSDVVCPWCHVGLANLDLALEGFEPAGKVEVVLRSFQLDPTAENEPAGSHTRLLAEKYGTSESEMRARQARIVSLGAERGLDFRFDRVRRGNTFDAHRLLHLAREHGLQRQLKDRLGRAYFTEGEPIGEADTLRKAAADIGLDPLEVEAVLAGDAYADDVRTDIETAQRLGITGVPFFVADGHLAASGAQPPEVLGQLLRRAWDDAHPPSTERPPDL
ncbi:MAG: DsbA family oxidoreductase [Acidimicrobiia bacterium]